MTASLKIKRRFWWGSVVELFLLECALLTAFLLRFDLTVPVYFRPTIAWAMLLWLAIKVSIDLLFRIHLASWRHFSTPEALRLMAARAVSSVAVSVIVLSACPYPFPRTVLAIDFALAVLFTIGFRALVRLTSETNGRPRNSGPHGPENTRIFIYGAGAGAVMLIREIRHNPALHYEICGLIDDDPAKRGLLIHGTKVLGPGIELSRFIAAYDPAEVIIAAPSASGADMCRIIANCQAASLPFRTMPALSEIISGRGLTRQIRDVAVDDVLGRSAIELDRAGIDRKLRGRVALVTGAAGSIGSELCRQIAACEPRALILLDFAETPLFHIERELRQAHPKLHLHAEVANIQNLQRLHEIFALYRPDIVYHAAAYKHVPMMETNVFEAIENNVVGTYNVALAAAEYGAGDFVLISSDKAVRPTNIMGVTKRAAELIVSSLQNGGPRYVSVRFGNVLGSSGSVVPIFKQQIAAGGPVTVTHPEMRRYFMTIPEAVQLVLQASTMSQGGEIFVLDMGSPVKILDLARQLIVLSGLKPDEDIRIEFSGVRPGEKLYEELRFLDEEVLVTTHNKIKVFAGHSPAANRMVEHLARLRGACERRDFKALMFELKEIEPDYNPSKEILTRAFESGLARRPELVNPEAEVAGHAVPVLVASGD
jgi:FlaA1/EpsC-like NDP-sugar epimerase